MTYEGNGAAEGIPQETGLKPKPRDAGEPIVDTAGDGAAGTVPLEASFKPEPKVDVEPVSDPVNTKGGPGEEREDHGIGVGVAEVSIAPTQLIPRAGTG